MPEQCTSSSSEGSEFPVSHKHMNALFIWARMFRLTQEAVSLDIDQKYEGLNWTLLGHLL